VLFKQREIAALEVCYSNREKKQLWKCVIQTERNSSYGSVLFKQRGIAALEVCYSNREEYQLW